MEQESAGPGGREQRTRFGVAAELDRLERGDGPAARARAVPPRHASRLHAPVHEGVWTRLRQWWAARDRGPGEAWHRLRCRMGHHEMRGGEQIQLGHRRVNLERCCRWCARKP